ncbi:MAG: SDR family oxidoreductase [Fimbriimonadaceae bacterium]|nr:SDR family oxidoreductase [Fimbriimonadaceae bacterium]
MSGDSLAGQRVLVTGSSRNTGLGLALAFARQGARLMVHGSDPANVTRAVAAVREAGAEAVAAVADLGTADGVEQLFAVVDAGLGGLDVLVNNAVHLGVGPTFVDIADDLLSAVLEVNLKGYFRCGQQAARRMIAAGRGGAIVNISSNTADRPVRGRSAYCASKGAIDALTRAMAVDLAPHGIRVNTVAPGYIWTDRWEQIGDACAARRRANIPLGEPATAAEVAAAVLYFAGPAAGNVTGARLVVDGGVMVQLVPADCDG